MARCSVQEMLEFLGDKKLRALTHRFDRELLLYEDLEDCDLPEGLTKDETWSILEMLKKQASVEFEDESLKNGEVWFSVTSAVSLNSKALELRSKAGFPLDNALVSLKGSPFLTRYIERTLLLALETEGIFVDKERIHAIFTGSAVPRSSMDKVVSNYIQLSADSDELAKRDITQGLIETIYYRLVEGVDVNEIPRRTCSLTLDERLTPKSSEECLKNVCLRAQRDCLDQLRFGPVLRLINIPWFFWNFEPFPHLNSLIGVLFRNILAIKWGYPILAWVPISYHPAGVPDASSDSGEGQSLKAVFNDCFVDKGCGFDFTSYFLAYLDVYKKEIDKFSTAIMRLQKLNSLIEDAFDFPMNNRQKSILSAVCKEPQSALRIAPHQRTFKIAYATARKDFLDLEKEGLLERDYEGRAFVFRAHPELRDKIMQLGEVAMGAS